MANASEDRNLLFGILALQMDFISREQLVAAMNAWVLVKEKPLGQILVEQNSLAAERRALLEALVAEHLKLHDNDPQRSLAAVSSVATIKEELAKIDDTELQASLRTMPTVAAPHDPYMTVAQSVGSITSSGSRFRIVRPHARGGLGEVFVAQDEELHREVAVKQIQMRHADEPDSRVRFVQEAKITGGLEHPGIVPVYGLGTYADGRPYYAMRFIRGDSLKDAIERFHSAGGKRRTPAERSLELRSLLGRFIDVCDAIEYAHSRGVLHRDLKPGNVMLGKYGETLVVDWGLAKSVDRPELTTRLGERALRPSTMSGSAPTQMGSAVGTPQFMSPEQAAGRLDQLGSTSDVYSLGATLYVLLTGHPAFEDTDLGLVLRKVERGEFPRPRDVNNDVPPALEAICLKAMSLMQADRYQTPRALADDIEHWLADEPVSAYQEPAGEKLARWSRRNRAWAQSIAAALVLVAGIAIVATIFVTRSWREEAAARAEADRGFRDARQAVNDYFTQVSEHKLLDVPGLQPLRKELLESARDYYQKFLDEHAGDPTLQADVALAWYRIGRVEAAIEKNDRAKREFEQALAIQEAMVKKSANSTATAALADTYNALGDLSQQTAKLDDARQWIQRAHNLRKQLVDSQPNDPLLRRKLANSENNLAIVDARLGHLAEAKQEFASAEADRQKLVSETSNQADADRYRRDLAEGDYNFGALLNQLNDFRSAADSLHRAVNGFQDLDKRDASRIEIRSKLAGAERVAADAERSAGDSPAALADYEQARKWAEPLARGNPLMTQLQADVAAIAIGLGEAKLLARDSGEALNQFKRARGILEQLAADDPTLTRYRLDLVNCLNLIAETEQGTGRLADARDALSAARGIAQQLLVELPDDSEVHRLFGKTLDGLSVIIWKDDQKKEAVSMSKEATPHLRTAYDNAVRDKSGLGAARAALSNHYVNLAVFLRKSGKPAESAAIAEERTKLWPGNPSELYRAAGELTLAAAAGDDASAEPTAANSSNRQAIIQKSIDVLQQAVQAGFDKFDDLQNDQKFKILAADPAFQKLLERGRATADERR
jgi:serine/threonine-protein kinase